MQTGQTYSITDRTASIGRISTAGGIVLRDPNVSRTHAELEFDGKVWLVRDLNSTNGTLVNGEDVTEAVLHSGDVLTIGLTDLEFQAG
jgi:pSer/pThr/pTyr-binding forkhead associated (FHA) protein